MFWSYEKPGWYNPDASGLIPADAVLVERQRYLQLVAQLSKGYTIVRGVDGQPVAVKETIPPTVDELCESVDAAADAARVSVAGNPLRAVEYERAAAEAQTFAAGGYQGEVPPMVAAWAISGRTPQQAADSILAEAAQYNGALVQLRTVRLQAKELIRAAINAGNIEHAQDIAAETIASIEAAVAGIGNNAS